MTVLSSRSLYQSPYEDTSWHSVLAFPHQRALSTIKVHLIWLSVRYCDNSTKWAISVISGDEYLKVFTLSNISTAGALLQLVNLLNAIRKSSTAKLWVSSRWIPPVEAHVNKQTQAFSVSESFFEQINLNIKGPAKSTPVWVYGWSSDTWTSGKSGTWQLAPSNLRHTIQDLIIFCTDFLPLKIQ